MYMSVQKMKERFANGTEELREDEYLGEDGLPRCKKCNGKRVFYDHAWCVRGLCDCEHEKMLKEEEEERSRKRVEAFRRNKRLSLIGERYIDCMFDNSKITDKNRDAFEKGKKYVSNSEEVFENNIGLYIYGDNSSGKTHLTACICNELVFRGWKRVYTSLATILNEIKGSYDGKGIGESEIIRKLQDCDFAFIDDIGKEFIGREYNESSAKWAERILFEIINARYNSQKPTIFTSNYSLSELASTLKLDKAIIERINEMATRVIKLEGDDFRSSTRSKRNKIAKELGL